MQNKLKHVICLIALGIFLCMGLASEFLDESTNVSVKLKPSDCKVMAPFTGTLNVAITAPSGTGGFPWVVEVFLSNQKINDTTECFSYYRHSIVQNTDVAEGGTITITSPSFTHDNKGDLWRVQVRARIFSFDEWSYNAAKVVFYDQTQLSFNLGSLPQL